MKEKFKTWLFALYAWVMGIWYKWTQKPPIFSAIGFSAEWELVCKDKHGILKWQETGHNAIAQEGEESILDVYLRGATAPSGFFVRLFNDTPVKTDSLGDLTGEPSGNGYAAATLERSAVGWPTLALDAGDYQATSKNIVITASGGTIGPVTHAIIATTSDNTGILVTYYALSTSRTLQDGDSLTITISEKLQPV